MSFNLHFGDVLDVCHKWPSPDCIIVDGPYGVGGFFGDPRTHETLNDWYEPHIKVWSEKSQLSTTLWFWGTEIGWATVHPKLDDYGWEYVQTIHWNKGKGHIAGNVNGNTIRQFPIVNEICVFYKRKMEFKTPEGKISANKWLINEWQRTGLPRKTANEACGVKDAATRKYFDQGWLWYPPPPDRMQKLAEYANLHGNPEGRPYYSLDGQKPLTSEDWEKIRYSWNHQHGITNVWDIPQLSGKERKKGSGRRSAPRVHNQKKGIASAHLNQKPLEIMRRIITSSTSEGDVIWEPFGGLCTASCVAIEMGRNAYCAEIDEEFHFIAKERLNEFHEKK